MRQTYYSSTCIDVNGTATILVDAKNDQVT